MVFKLVDLFAGCGGLGLGFHEAGFETILANELNPDPATTYCRNLLDGQEERMLLGPIQEQLSSHAIEMRRISQMDVDCIAGGPPCQGLSLAGRGDPDDPRNMLFKEYLRVVKQIQPRSVLFENVPGFVNRYGLGLKSHLENELSRMGYIFNTGVIRASDYGVPQNRKRFFLVGIHSNYSSEAPELPTPTWTEAERNRLLTTRKIIGDLNSYSGWGGYGTGEIHGPSEYTQKARSSFAKEMRRGSDQVGFTWNTKIPKHGKIVSERMRRIQLGETKEDWVGTKLATTKHSQSGLSADSFENITILSTPDDFVHYDQQLPRTLSVRECARFQTFPDHFHFYGKRTTGGERREIDVPQYTQVANAIPPRLARILAEEISKFL